MNKIIKKLARPIYYFFWENYIMVMNILFPTKVTDFKNIPIIINNRNRLGFLKLLIEALEKRGYKNINIIDNNSNYQPLLEYYNTTPYKVYRLKENVGFLALWQTDVYKDFIKGYYVYTDSDVVPIEDCPDDILETFYKKMQEDKRIMKIGLGLKIDDLPDCFNKKEEVIKWEKQYHKVSEGGYFLANVDTTFALYRPYMSQGASRLKMLRSQKPYLAYHMPWYNDSENLSEEELFYINNAKGTHWTILAKK